MAPPTEKPPVSKPPVTDTPDNDDEDFVPRVAAPDEPRVYGSRIHQEAAKALHAANTELHSQEAMAAKLRAIAHMSALMYKTKDIARAMGMQESRVSTLRNLPEVKALARKLTTDLFLSNPEARFRSMAPKAAATIYKVMTNDEEKGSTRLAAAAEILDRAYGKATQKVEHTGSLFKEMLERLDKESEAEVKDGDIIDAEIVEAALEIERKPAAMVQERSVAPSPEPKQGVDKEGAMGEDIDQWVKNHLG